MGWIEVSVPVSFGSCEAVSYVLQCLTDNAGLVEEHKEDIVIYKIYLQEENFTYNFNKLKQSLQDLVLEGEILSLDEISFISLRDENWSESWKKFFEPLKISKNIVVKPPWKEYKPGEEEIVIIINPGMAFGIGSHETTRMASGLIEKYAPGKNSLLDPGCGTGILSIIACYCGVNHIYAIDNDELAISALKENLALNNCVDKVKYYHQNGLTGFPYKVQLIVANIQASVFKVIRKEFSPVLTSDGILILTGILEEQQDDILSIFHNEGFILIEKLHEAEWVSLVLKCEK